MTTFDLFALRNLFEDQGVMICFSGPFSHSVIEELGVAVRKYLVSAEAPKDRFSDVFSVFVEQAQNLKNYAARKEFAHPSRAHYQNGTLAIARQAERYVVSSGNLVKKEDTATISSSLSALAGLDKLELKALYKERLRRPQEGGGAGLGFIDMARKASEPVIYSLRDLTDGSVFFDIRVVI